MRSFFHMAQRQNRLLCKRCLPRLYFLSLATLSALSGTLSCAPGTSLPPIFASSLSSALYPACAGSCESIVDWFTVAPTPSNHPVPGFFLPDYPSCLCSLLDCPEAGCPSPVCTSAEVAPLDGVLSTGLFAFAYGLLSWRDLVGLGWAGRSCLRAQCRWGVVRRGNGSWDLVVAQCPRVFRARQGCGGWCQSLCTMERRHESWLRLEHVILDESYMYLTHQRATEKNWKLWY